MTNTSTLQYTRFFWDTPLHVLKTCFSWESSFIMFLQFQKSLTVSFQGCWTQWKRCESPCDRSYGKINWQTYPPTPKTHTIRSLKSSENYTVYGRQMECTAFKREISDITTIALDITVTLHQRSSEMWYLYTITSEKQWSVIFVHN